NQRVAPHTRVPGSSGTKTTDTPASRHSRVIRLVKLRGSSLVRERIRVSACLKELTLNSSQRSFAASSSPFRSHAAVAPGSLLKVGDIRKAGLDAFHSPLQLVGEATPKK